jgi:hypothetical protein
MQMAGSCVQLSILRWHVTELCWQGSCCESATYDQGHDHMRMVIDDVYDII